MKITKTKKTFQISLDSNTDDTNYEKEEEKDILDKFIQPCDGFSFSTIEHQEIEKEKKKLVYCAVQHGIRNQKTTSTFLSFLEKVRKIGTSDLQREDYANAISYYLLCLGFVDPDDQIYLQQFVFTKIDIINKMMFAIFQLGSEKGEKKKNIERCIAFLQNFLFNIKNLAFYENFLQDQSSFIELNYFYLGKLYKKDQKILKAIQMFQLAYKIIQNKKYKKIYEKRKDLVEFANNFQIKINYMISECYRQKDSTKQKQFEINALETAQKLNHGLYQHIKREIKFYQKSKQFKNLLQSTENIEELVDKSIQESKNNNTSSLYDAFEDNFYRKDYQSLTLSCLISTHK